MNYNTFIDWARDNLTEEDINDIKHILNLDRFYNLDVYEQFTQAIITVHEYKGEYANEYDMRYDYIYSRCAFEKDFFSNWLEGCDIYPNTYEIIDVCQYIQNMIELWKYAIEKGWIDGEEGWEEQRCA